jgi:hypothetical protein
MCRTAFAAVALALLALAGVESVRAIQPARTQRRSASTRTKRATHQPVVARGTHQTPVIHSKTHSSSGANLSVAGRKRTPDEVGRAAGLAIRRQLARRQMGRDAASVRAGRSRNARRPKLERTALRTTESSAARVSEADEARTANPVPDTRQPETDELSADGGNGAESRPIDEAREANPATSAAETDQNAGGSDTVSAPVKRMTPSDGGVENRAAKRNNDAAAQNGEQASPTTPIETGEEAGFAGTKTRGAIASLVMPRSGMPPSLRGSLASLQRQNDRLDAEGLERIENESDLAARIADKLLVPLPASSALTVNARLEENHRYCRPWTARFLADLARAHEAAFHDALEVSSAVRTVEYQKRLMRTNGNAAQAEGELVSPHLTGATIDIAKKGLNRAEMAWMRKQLAGLQAAGKIDVEEEFKQACFHITVYKNYVAAGKTVPATPSKPATRGTPRQTAEEADEAQGT